MPTIDSFLPVETLYGSGATLYFVLRSFINNARVVWNASTGAWEAYNSAHWSQYAIPMTEDAGSGYYSGVYPAAAITAASGDELPPTTEVVYVQAGAGPLLTDAPATGIGNSQGVNVWSINRSSTAAQNLQQSADCMVPGACAGTPTITGALTNLTSTQVGAFIGRSIVFYSGGAVEQASIITGYDGAGNLTWIALASAPVAGDLFIIV